MLVNAIENYFKEEFKCTKANLAQHRPPRACTQRAREKCKPAAVKCVAGASAAVAAAVSPASMPSPTLLPSVAALSLLLMSSAAVSPATFDFGGGSPVHLSFASCSSAGSSSCSSTSENENTNIKHKKESTSKRRESGRISGRVVVRVRTPISEHPRSSALRVRSIIS